MRSLPYLFCFPGAKVLRQEDCGPRGKARKEIYGQLRQAVYAVNGGQSAGAGEPPDDDAVGRGVELLKQAPRQKRQGKFQNSLPYGTVR